MNCAVNEVRNMSYKHFFIEIVRIHHCDLRFFFVAAAELGGVGRDEVEGGSPRTEASLGVSGEVMTPQHTIYSALWHLVEAW